MIRILRNVAMLACAGLWALPVSAWQAEETDDPIGGERACVLLSDPVTVDDGYADTEARLLYNGSDLAVVSDSPIDAEYDDMTLTVDDAAPIPVERVAGEHAVVFREPEQAIGQLRPGYEAVAHLRFWPTWPSKGLIAIPFDLIGFTRALEGLPACRGAE